MQAAVKETLKDNADVSSRPLVVLIEEAESVDPSLLQDLILVISEVIRAPHGLSHGPNAIHDILHKRCCSSCQRRVCSENLQNRHLWQVFSKLVNSAEDRQIPVSVHISYTKVEKWAAVEATESCKFACYET